MKKILLQSLVLISLSATLYAQTSTNILVYAGPGAGLHSLSHTIAMLRQLVADEYNILAVDAEYILDPDWIQNTALLVIPGGADRPYVAHLHGQGNANIKKYVQSGGKLLGICAGAYYSADRIEFAKGDADLEVTGERELKFYPGLVEGPTYTGFDHRNVHNNKGARAAKLSWQMQSDNPFKLGQEFFTFYNGGGHFKDPHLFKNVEVLANYTPENNDAPQSPAAIVACTVGKGKAILSGVHFEWEPQSLDLQSIELKQLKPKLVAGDESRILLAKFILSYLDVKLKIYNK